MPNGIHQIIHDAQHILYPGIYVVFRARVAANLASEAIGFLGAAATFVRRDCAANVAAAAAATSDGLANCCLISAAIWFKGLVIVWVN